MKTVSMLIAGEQVQARNGATFERRNPLDYRYSVIGVGPGASDLEPFYPPNLIRSVLGGTTLPFEHRSFRMRLGWPGKEGQARAITTVTEEAI